MSFWSRHLDFHETFIDWTDWEINDFQSSVFLTHPRGEPFYCIMWSGWWRACAEEYQQWAPFWCIGGTSQALFYITKALTSKCHPLLKGWGLNAGAEWYVCRYSGSCVRERVEFVRGPAIKGTSQLVLEMTTRAWRTDESWSRGTSLSFGVGKYSLVFNEGLRYYPSSSLPRRCQKEQF